jgi:hypothetical protein
MFYANRSISLLKEGEKGGKVRKGGGGVTYCTRKRSGNVENASDASQNTIERVWLRQVDKHELKAIFVC